MLFERLVVSWTPVHAANGLSSALCLSWISSQRYRHGMQTRSTKFHVGLAAWEMHITSRRPNLVGRLSDTGEVRPYRVQVQMDVRPSSTEASEIGCLRSSCQAAIRRGTISLARTSKGALDAHRFAKRSAALATEGSPRGLRKRLRRLVLRCKTAYLVEQDRTQIDPWWRAKRTNPQVRCWMTTELHMHRSKGIVSLYDRN